MKSLKHKDLSTSLLIFHIRLMITVFQPDIQIYPELPNIIFMKTGYQAVWLKQTEVGNQTKPLVSGDKKCWLTPVLYIFRIIGTDPDLARLHLIEKDNIKFLVRNKLEDHFKEKFRKEIGNSSKLTLYSSIKDDFKEEQYISDVKYYKYRSAVTKFRISAHTFPIEKGSSIEHGGTSTFSNFMALLAL